MRLTKHDVDVFVKAVLDDVPTKDYETQARKLVQDHFISKLPPKLRAVYDDEKLRAELHSHWYRTDGFVVSVYGPTEAPLPPSFKARVAALMKKHEAQRARIKELREKLRGTVRGITTRAKLVEALPEFAKYAPPEIPATPNLPVVANVVSAFVKAGWPKPSGKAPDNAPTK